MLMNMMLIVVLNPTCSFLQSLVMSLLIDHHHLVLVLFRLGGKQEGTSR